jgi:hypothetical protein
MTLIYPSAPDFFGVNSFRSDIKYAKPVPEHLLLLIRSIFIDIKQDPY